MNHRARPSARTAVRFFILGLLLCAGVAQAGEIILFEHDRFRGRKESLYGTLAELSSMRFANEISSIIVKSGTWELCTDLYHRGTCRTFQPGEYSQIGDLNDRVRSVRELASRQAPVQSGQPNHPNQVDSSRGITLYEHGSYSGRAVSLNGPVNSLESVGMNDSVSSLIVRGGVWELCVHANFQPPCKQYGRGDHSYVGDQFNDQFSSARPINSVSSYPSTPAPSYPSSPPPSGSYDNRGDAIVFSGENFSGGSRALTGRTESFETIGFNDITASIIVNRGNWQFCTDANYRGNCQTLGPGRYGSLDGGLRRQISSARPERGSGSYGEDSNRGSSGSSGNWGGSSGWRGGGWSGNRGSVTLYEYDDFAGRSYTVTNTIVSLDSVNFNDRASSVIVERGTWEFCTDANFQGTCRTVGPGRYGSIPREMDSKISSVRQVGQ